MIFILIAILFSAPLTAFESAEHMFIGDAVQLEFPDGKSPSLLRLPNGLEASYGEILALGGDYFAVNAFPISQGKTRSEQKQRFLNAFGTLADSHLAPGVAVRLIATFRKTLSAILQGEKEGKSPSEVYAEIGGELLREGNVMTGGGCFITPFYPLGTATLQLLSEANWDHFVPNALLAYQAGHLAAIEKAIEAGKMRGEEQQEALELAYAMNAFACHFLSDSFSSGHMRTPRQKLSEQIDLAFVAALLMDYMHGEDCKNGLSVSNLNGDEWIAYGDSYYFNEENAYSRSILEQVMQISADEVYFAFKEGEGKVSDPICHLLPQFDLLQDQDSRINTSPLFLWDGALKRRIDINGLYSYAWTAEWWGWSTLVDLADAYKPLTHRQKALHKMLFMHGTN